MKFSTRGQLTDLITCVKFLFDRFRGYGVLTPPKLPFPNPIDLVRRPYNSVRTTVRHCEKSHTSGLENVLDSILLFDVLETVSEKYGMMRWFKSMLYLSKIILFCIDLLIRSPRVDDHNG